MRSLSWLFACAGLAAIIAGPASAQNPPVPLIDGPTYLMTYLEVVPSANRAPSPCSKTIPATRPRGRAPPMSISTRKRRPVRFILSEIWQNRGMAGDHAKVRRCPTWPRSSSPSNSALPTSAFIRPIRPPPKAPSANDVHRHQPYRRGHGGNAPEPRSTRSPRSGRQPQGSRLVRYEILDEVPAHVNHFRSFEE